MQVEATVSREWAYYLLHLPPDLSETDAFNFLCKKPSFRKAFQGTTDLYFPPSINSMQLFAHRPCRCRL